VGTDEELGFFPGTIEEKYKEWMSPFIDAFKAQLGAGNFEQAMKHDETIVFAPLATMRGRSLEGALIILD
jgi:phosphate starvation-inducible PhoH-like protein